MSNAYYNEIDPKAAAWLRELIKQGHISKGVVDERSIEDVKPAELMGFTQCHFFAGIGVWSHALRQAGWPDDKPVWTGSCPCQPFSVAGEGKGFNDERHLWPAFHWLIKQCKPYIVFGEQVSGKVSEQWVDLVSTDLEAEGFTFGQVVFPACSIGAPHMRKRAYWVADSECERWKRLKQNNSLPSSESTTYTKPSNVFAHARKSLDNCKSDLLQRDGTTVGMERVCLKGYGNGLVAPQAQGFIEAYLERNACT